jgi:hypothetical protein
MQHTVQCNLRAGQAFRATRAKLPRGFSSRGFASASRRFLRWSGAYGLTLVTQTAHKEPMRIAERSRVAPEGRSTTAPEK